MALVVSTTVMRKRASLRTEALPMTSGSLMPTCTSHQTYAPYVEAAEGLTLQQVSKVLQWHTQDAMPHAIHESCTHHPQLSHHDVPPVQILCRFAPFLELARLFQAHHC